MTVKELKNALLQEAVQGKLVPQIASEGNARDLLEEIRKEKLSHGLDFANAKSGKIKSKKETALAGSNPCDITEDEIPFEIPENWCWCRLGEVFETTSGTTPQSKNPIYYNNGTIGWVRTTDLNNGILSFAEIKITEKAKSDCNLKIIPKNSVCIALYGGAGTIGKNAILNFETTINQSVCAILPTKFADMRYLQYFLQWQRPYWMDYASGSRKDPNINQIIVKNCPFPLPPLAEQKRIVAAIEKFMPLIEEYGKKETQLKAINEKIGALTKKAILQEAVQGKLVPQIAAEGNAKDLLEEIKKEKNILIKEGKIKKEKTLPEISDDEIPFDIPENWCWCRLSELCNLYTGDSINETEKKLKYTNVKEGWFYIGTKDVNFDQTINYDNGIKIPFEKDNFRIAPKNTVLMCIEGGSAGRKIAFTNQDVCFGNKLCCFNSYKNEIEKFIFYFLQSTLFTDAFKDNINGIIGGVSINNLKGMLFPLPPLAEQKRIVDTIEKILPLCKKL